MAKIDITTAKNVIESNPRKAYFKIKNTGGPRGATGEQGPQGIPGSDGAQGVPGKAATVTIGSTTTLPAGSNATVTNSGDQYDAVLEFGIPTGPQGPTGATGGPGPRGFRGERGEKGDPGAAATITLGSVSTGEAGTDAAIVNTGDEHNAVYNFTIPRGAKGDTGTSPTVSVYGTETLPAGSQATVTNVGTSQDVQLQFGIPQGEAGKNTKLYSSTGQNTDGAMTQKATTDALAPKLEAGVVDSLPATGEEGKLYLTPKSYTTGTATGNPITITLGEEAGQITDAKLDGDTYQQSYTGKNLYVAQSSSTINNVTLTLNNDGTYSLSGTATAAANFVKFIDLSDALIAQGDELALSSTKPLPGGVEVRYEAYDGTTWKRHIVPQLLSTRQTTTTASANLSGADRIRQNIYVASGTDSTTSNFGIQLEKSAEATSFEPFVGGKASPNPDYPQQIQTVTGTQTVEVVGKNLFNKDNFVGGNFYVASTGTITEQANYRSIVVPCLPSTTYTVSKQGQSPLRVAYCNSTSVQAGDTAYGYQRDTTANSQALTITTGEQAKTLVVTYKEQGYTIGTDITSLMIELGSTATTYATYNKQTLPIYLGSIELCKLGDYQDYIYKDGSDWKVHKATKSVTLTGSENWQYRTAGTTADFYQINNSNWNDYFGAGTNAIGTGSTDVQPISAFAADKLTSIDANDTNMKANEGIGKKGQWFRISLLTSRGVTSVEGFKTWLASNNVKTYYALATATDTTITDTTLIAQLEAVRTASLQASNTITNTATGSNLAGDLELGYEEYNPTNRYDKWLWLDLNNNYEKLGS